MDAVVSLRDAILKFKMENNGIFCDNAELFNEALGKAEKAVKIYSPFIRTEIMSALVKSGINSRFQPKKST
jgi:hypothetical protein